MARPLPSSLSQPLKLLGVVVLAAAGLFRFTIAGLLPAVRELRGDFGASFPTAYFARMRPDFPSDNVWSGWNYGPALHFLTAPLLLVPTWSMVPPVWAGINLGALVVCFVAVWRLSGVAGRVSRAGLGVLVSLWCLFQPLGNCFAQGNIELVEMAIILAGVVALPRFKGTLSGAMLGVATMLKFLPAGFLCWLVLRQQWRAVVAGFASVLALVFAASLTLGWKDSISLNAMKWAVAAPIGGPHELSVNSMFLHWAGVFDATDFVTRWIPSTRGQVAVQAGWVAGILLIVGFSLALFRQRHRPVSGPEVGVLFMAMLMIPPWNHDYYFVFALVPFSILFLRGVADRDWTLLTVTSAAYLLMSPILPFGWINRQGWFETPFVYVLNFNNIPAIGALVLWFATTREMLAEAGPSATGSRPGWRRGWIAIGIVLTVAGLAGWSLRYFYVKPQKSPSTWDIALAPPMVLSSSSSMALSPDGTQLAYVASADRANRLCIHAIEIGTTKCLPGTDNPSEPFFSPDGRWLGFVADGRIKKTPVAGGAVTVVSNPAGQAPSWDRTGGIVFATAQGIMRVPEAGGPASVLIQASATEDGRHQSPGVVRAGDLVVFSVAPLGGGYRPGRVFLQDLRTGQRTRLPVGSQPKLDPAAERLVYAHNGGVYATVLDPATHAASNVSVPVVSDAMSSIDGFVQFASTAADILVYVPSDRGKPVVRQLAWVDRLGGVTPLSIQSEAFETPRLSRDGRSFAVAIGGGRKDIWRYDPATGELSRVSASASQNRHPVWTPDGRSLAYSNFGHDDLRPAVMSTAIGLDQEPVELWQGEAPVQLGSWSWDGQALIGTQAGDIWILNAMRRGPASLPAGQDEARTRERPWFEATVLQTPFIEDCPVFSPDGQWIAVTSDRFGRSDVFLVPYPGLDTWRRVSTNGGEEPRWSRDGRELFYRNGDTMMAVDVRTIPSVALSKPRPLFSGSFVRGTGAANYDVTPDGKRFLMIAPEPPSVTSMVRVVRDWSTSLPR